MSRAGAAPSLLGRLASPFREFGWLAGTLYLIDRVLRGLSPRLGLYVYELMVQPITGRALLGPKLVRDLRFDEIGPGHPALALMPAREDIKAARFAQGARCLGVWRRDELIGYLWFRAARYQEDEVRCTYHLQPAAASVFDFDLYVMPAHRMGLGFMAVWHGANQHLHAQGIRYTFSRLTRFNLASRKAHAHLGWKRVGRAVFLHAGPVELMVATVRPWLAVTAAPGQRVALHLQPAVLDALPAATAAPPAPNTLKREPPHD